MHIQDRWMKPGPTGRKIKSDRYGTGSRWQAVWREPDGTRRRKSFTHKDAAQAHLDNVAHTTRSGTYVAVERGSLTLGEWADRWIPAQTHLKPGGLSTVTGIVTKHITPCWGRCALNEISRADIQAWVTGLDVAPATTRRIHGVLQRMLEDAVDDMRIARNPARGVNLPSGAHREHRYLTVLEVDALIDSMPEHHRPITRCLAWTGLRFGEAAELRVKDLDLDARRISVTRSVSTTTGVALVSTPKTSAGSRAVPIADEVLDDLVTLAEDRQRDDLVYLTPYGAQYRKDNYRRVFQAAVRDAGLGEVRVHDLRHTAVSIAIAAGASVKLVQRMVGHASAAITLDVYAGLFEQELATISQRVSEYAKHERQPPLSPQHPSTAA